MGKLIYSALQSLDGYIEDAGGDFDWAEPDAEVHAAVNDVMRGIGTQLLGRRMYEVMSAWETMGGAGDPDHIRDFAELWRASDKVVYSTRLERPVTARTSIEREFDPDVVRGRDHDVSIAGPTLAAHAFAAGIVDTLHLFVSPVIVGAGKPALPDRFRADLELIGERRFGNGTVHLHYGVAPRS